jgi:hypothetical protein
VRDLTGASEHLRCAAAPVERWRMIMLPKSAPMWLQDKSELVGLLLTLLFLASFYLGFVW